MTDNPTPIWPLLFQSGAIIYVTFPERVMVENSIPRNMIINLACATVDNHISREDIFDYQPLRECNIYIISIYFFRLL